MYNATPFHSIIPKAFARERLDGKHVVVGKIAQMESPAATRTHRRQRCIAVAFAGFESVLKRHYRW